MIFSLIIILVLFLILDSIYIGIQFKHFTNLYKKIQGKPLRINFLGAGLCYAILTFIVYYYIILPKKSVRDAFILGFCVYGVYDTTTYALLEDYPASTAIMDTFWGGTLFALITIIHKFIYKTI